MSTPIQTEQQQQPRCGDFGGFFPKNRDKKSKPREYGRSKKGNKNDFVLKANGMHEQRFGASLSVRDKCLTNAKIRIRLTWCQSRVFGTGHNTEVGR